MKKIGEIKGIPVVEGNVNEVTKNQIHYKEYGGGIQLSKRSNDNKLNSVTGSSSSTTSNIKYYSFNYGNNEFEDNGIHILSLIVNSVKGIYYSDGKRYCILPTSIHNSAVDYPFARVAKCSIDWNIEFINYGIEKDENDNSIYINSLYDYLSRFLPFLGLSSIEELLSKLGLTECTKEEFYDLTKE